MLFFENVILKITKFERASIMLVILALSVISGFLTAMIFNFEANLFSAFVAPLILMAGLALVSNLCWNYSARLFDRLFEQEPGTFFLYHVEKPEKLISIVNHYMVHLRDHILFNADRKEKLTRWERRDSAKKESLRLIRVSLALGLPVFSFWKKYTRKNCGLSENWERGSE